MKHDGQLGDPPADAQRAIGELDLKRVTLRMRGVIGDRPERVGSEALEAGRQIAYRQSEQRPCVGAARA